MKKLLAIVAAFAASGAVAAPIGFFHDLDAAKAPAHAKELAKSTLPCAISARYNVATPAKLELSYIGSTSCFGTAGAAADAAFFAGPKADIVVGGEPAQTPTYECGIVISWDPSSPRSPSVSPSGSGCGGSVESTALFETARAVHCANDPVSLTCGP